MENTTENLKYLQGAGHRIYPQVITKDKSREIFYGVTLELCFFIFGDYAQELINCYGVNATRIISDVQYRRSLNIPDNILKRNGNPRESIILKKSGKTALYISPYIRDGIRRNINVFKMLNDV